MRASTRVDICFLKDSKWRYCCIRMFLCKPNDSHLQNTLESNIYGLTRKLSPALMSLNFKLSFFLQTKVYVTWISKDKVFLPTYYRRRLGLSFHSHTGPIGPLVQSNLSPVSAARDPCSLLSPRLGQIESVSSTK